MSRADETKVFAHESYGLAGFSRISHSGRTRLFGSALEEHHSTIMLRIHHAERHHHLARDWFHASRSPMIEVQLSAAQFADMLTSMNMGDGVPCTIRTFNGKDVAEPPAEYTEAEEIRTSFKERTSAIGKRLSALRANVATALEAKGVTGAVRNAVIQGVDGIIRDVQQELPFILTSFQEASTRVVAAAKSEIEAFTAHAIHRAGLEHLLALKESNEQQSTPQALPAHDEASES